MSFDYEKYTNDKLKAIGLNPDELTQAQKDIILQPSEAPENYYHDGEVTAGQAKRIWRDNLKKSGLSALQIFKVEQAMR
jgi:hypothetical protein